MQGSSRRSRRFPSCTFALKTNIAFEKSRLCFPNFPNLQTSNSTESNTVHSAIGSSRIQTVFLYCCIYSPTCSCLTLPCCKGAISTGPTWSFGNKVGWVIAVWGNFAPVFLGLMLSIVMSFASRRIIPPYNGPTKAHFVEWPSAIANLRREGIIFDPVPS